MVLLNSHVNCHVDLFAIPSPVNSWATSAPDSYLRVCFRNIILVGGLEHVHYDFPYIGNVIIPADFHIVQRGRYTTNQCCFSPVFVLNLLLVPKQNPTDKD